jgi:hypothetical protein
LEVQLAGLVLIRVHLVVERFRVAVSVAKGLFSTFCKVRKIKLLIFKKVPKTKLFKHAARAFIVLHNGNLKKLGEDLKNVGKLAGI